MLAYCELRTIVQRALAIRYKSTQIQGLILGFGSAILLYCDLIVCHHFIIVTVVKREEFTIFFCQLIVVLGCLMLLISFEIFECAEATFSSCITFCWPCTLLFQRAKYKQGGSDQTCCWVQQSHCCR
jgi:predicted neutral ceramidase superfamily lipid hydrolase